MYSKLNIGPWYATRPEHANGWWLVSKDPYGEDSVDESGDGGFNEETAYFIAATPDALEATRKALQLARVASDWNLNEVEVDGEMVSIDQLIEEFTTVLTRIIPPSKENI